jgi:hypothetical protein
MTWAALHSKHAQGNSDDKHPSADIMTSLLMISLERGMIIAFPGGLLRVQIRYFEDNATDAVAERARKIEKPKPGSGYL